MTLAPILSWRLSPTLFSLSRACPSCARWRRMAEQSQLREDAIRSELLRSEAGRLRHAPVWAPETAA